MRYFVVFLIMISLFACKSPQAFEYRQIRDIKFEALGFDKSTISMNLVYFNPNNFGVNLKHVDCDIYVNKNYLGKYVLDTMMHIAKRSEFALPSKMDVNMQNVFKNSLNALFGQEILLDVKGTTRVGKGGIYITVPFTYSGRHKLDLF